MENEIFEIKAKVWIWQGDSPWHFITIEKGKAHDIKKSYHWPRRGFGAIPVNVTVGKTTWKTSVFPEKEGAYLLPIKKAVRISENIQIGQTINLTIEVLN